jgi:hypothetical protein
MANGGAAATLKKITETFACLHADLANEIQNPFRVSKASTPTAVTNSASPARGDGGAREEDYSRFMLPAVTTAERAELYFAEALRSPHIYVSRRRSDCYVIETPTESAQELFAMALRKLQESR